MHSWLLLVHIDGNATKVTIDEKLTTEYESMEYDGFDHDDDLDEEGLIDITEFTCENIASQLASSSSSSSC